MPSFLLALDRHFPTRYLTLLAMLGLLIVGAYRWLNTGLSHG